MEAAGQTEIKSVGPISKAKMNMWDRYILGRIKKNKNFLCIVVGQTGCQPAGSKVMLSDGSYKYIEDIKVGDKVMSPQADGSCKYANVTNVSNWFEEELYDVYRLNGNKQKLYSCSHNHLIPLYHSIAPKIKGKKQSDLKYTIIKNYDAKTYSGMAKNQKSHCNIGFSMFSIDSFEGRMNCQIEPYTLGVLLGDGCLQSYYRYCYNESVWNKKNKRIDAQAFRNKKTKIINITSADIEVIEEVSKFYSIMFINQKKGSIAKSYAFSINGILSELLDKYKLSNSNSGNKFIPKDALYSDIEYRKRLLAGLIDTDGYYSPGKGGYNIVSKSKQLAQDILQLVYSLGGRGNILPITKKIKSTGFIGNYFSVNFYLSNMKLPMQVKRKHREHDLSTCYLSSNRVAVDSIKSNKKSQVYGFEIDSPSKLYITDNYMVTHNSGKSFACLSKAAKLDPTFTVDRAYFSQEKLIKDIDSGVLNRGHAVVVEELGVQMGSRDWQSKTNKNFSKLLQTFRHIGLICFFNVPNLSFVDVHARALFHALWVMQDIDMKAQESIVKPFVIQNNPMATTASKTSYQKYLRGYANNEWGVRSIVVVKEIRVERPEQSLVDLYETKKKEFTKKLNKDMMLGDVKVQTKEEHPRVDYDALDELLGMGWTAKRIAKSMKIGTRTVDRRRSELKQEDKIILPAKVMVFP